MVTYENLTLDIHLRQFFIIINYNLPIFFIHQRFIDTLRIFSLSKHRKTKNFFKIGGQEVATFPSL
jgi:hypothetical protein